MTNQNEMITIKNENGTSSTTSSSSMHNQVLPDENRCKSSACLDDHDCSSESIRKFRFEPLLYMQRYDYVVKLLNEYKCHTYMDLGCAECKLIRFVKNSVEGLSLIVGVDLDDVLLNEAKSKFHDNLFDFLQPRDQPLDIYLISGDLSNPSPYLIEQMRYENTNLDCISMVELIEHMHADVLEKSMDTVFAKLRPRLVIISTPNYEFNVVFDELERASVQSDECLNGDRAKTAHPDSTSVNERKFRHYDHKFEWTRGEFQAWCQNQILKKYTNYKLVRIDGVGSPPQNYAYVGFCSQIAVFERHDCAITVENKFQLYLKKRRLINAINFQNRSFDKVESTPYIVSKLLYNPNEFDDKINYFSCYKLISHIMYPFEAIEFENDTDRTVALLNEIDYLAYFLKSESEHDESNVEYEEIRRQKSLNHIDISNKSVSLISIEKLLTFKNVAKFKLTFDEFVQILKENKYKLTDNENYIIHHSIKEGDEERDTASEQSYESCGKEQDYFNKQDKLASPHCNQSKEPTYRFNDEEDWDLECSNRDLEEKSSNNMSDSTISSSSNESLSRFYSEQEQFENCDKNLLCMKKREKDVKEVNKNVSNSNKDYEVNFYAKKNEEFYSTLKAIRKKNLKQMKKQIYDDCIVNRQFK
jgi:small RNA 2'-O-methyltransferase